MQCGELTEWQRPQFLEHMVAQLEAQESVGRTKHRFPKGDDKIETVETQCK